MKYNKIDKYYQIGKRNKDVPILPSLHIQIIHMHYKTFQQILQSTFKSTYQSPNILKIYSLHRESNPKSSDLLQKGLAIVHYTTKAVRSVIRNEKNFYLQPALFIIFRTNLRSHPKLLKYIPVDFYCLSNNVCF